ncbi:MAG: hypothetical protein GIX02_00610 [Candidatus Eremiobacteraeota bacterium]|nr:hypothetical protein [Candidatus Eremiobacteraeota bacterium]
MNRSAFLAAGAGAAAIPIVGLPKRADATTMTKTIYSATGVPLMSGTCTGPHQIYYNGTNGQGYVAWSAPPNRIYQNLSYNLGGSLYVRGINDSYGDHNDTQFAISGHTQRDDTTTFTHYDSVLGTATVHNSGFAAAERQMGTLYGNHRDNITWECFSSTIGNWLAGGSWAVKAYRILRAANFVTAEVPIVDLVDLGIQTVSWAIISAGAMYFCSRVPAL